MADVEAALIDGRDPIPPVRVLIADDNTIVRLGLTRLLEPFDDIEVVGVAANGIEALEVAERTAPDLVLLDVRMPLADGISVAERLARRCKVLMLTHSEDADTVARAVDAGASGYLVYGSFDPAELVTVIRSTIAGGSFLSPSAAVAVIGRLRAVTAATGLRDRDDGPLSEREREIMDLIAAGLSNNDVATKLFLSTKTVKNHINRIFAKLGVASRGQAIAAWLGSAGHS